MSVPNIKDIKALINDHEDAATVEVTATFKARLVDAGSDMGDAGLNRRYPDWIEVRLQDRSRRFAAGTELRHLVLDLDEVMEMQPCELAKDEALPGEFTQVSKVTLRRLMIAARMYTNSNAYFMEDNREILERAITDARNVLDKKELSKQLGDP